MSTQSTTVPMSEKAIDGLIDLMGNTQLKYQRLHFSDYVRELAPRPSTVSMKIALPSFFKTLIQVQGSTQPVPVSVSGKKYSLWHCILCILLPKFMEQTWYARKEIVDKFIDELNHDVSQHFRKDELLKMTRLNPGMVRFHDLLPADDLLYYLSSRFRINIVIVDSVTMRFIHRDMTFDPATPTIILYQDDSPTFHVIQINDRNLFSVLDPEDAATFKDLYALAPEVNRILAEYLKKDTDIETYAKVNKLSPSEQFKMEVKPTLSGLKLDELRALAHKFGLPTEKQGKTKMIRMTKKEIISSIMTHHDTD